MYVSDGDGEGGVCVCFPRHVENNFLTLAGNDSECAGIETCVLTPQHPSEKAPSPSPVRGSDSTSPSSGLVFVALCAARDISHRISRDRSRCEAFASAQW